MAEYAAFNRGTKVRFFSGEPVKQKKYTIKIKKIFSFHCKLSYSLTEKQIPSKD